MKKLLIMMIAVGSSLAAMSQQVTPGYATDRFLSRWVIDLNLLGGLANQDFTTANTSLNYLNGLNLNTGKLTYSKGTAFGADAQLGVFFGNKRHIGLGAGIMYMQQNGTATLNNYHVEYQTTDAAGNIYRQVVDGNVKEDIKSTIINIPVVLKYKNRFSKHWGFTADAGVVFNMQMNNAYTTHSSFDYGAIYKFTPADGGPVSVYDNAPVASADDWFITRAEFLKNNPNGNLEDYFSKKRALGINVGDGMNSASHSGHTSYTTGSVGFLIQPSFNYFLSDNVALNFGGFYMFQPFKNEAQKNYRLVNGVSDYNSVLNSVTASNNQSYGLNIGARFFLGRKKEPLMISSIDEFAPTECGSCDGVMLLHGLSPNQPVTIGYSMNGRKSENYSTTVQPDGEVRISNLCPGNYTGIKATIKKRNANGSPVVIHDHVMEIPARKIINPSAIGACDGSIVLSDLPIGKSVTINYDKNGTTQTPFTGIVGNDRKVSINGLCNGNYTNVVATIKNCSANVSDFSMTDPTPVPVVVPVVVPAATVIQDGDISTPILFDFNMYQIHEVYYPILDEAARQMRNNHSKTLTIDAYTDKIGSEAYNNVLSNERANAVKTHLVNMGIEPRRINAVGHGEKFPAANNNTAEGRDENRRAIMK